MGTNVNRLNGMLTVLIGGMLCFTALAGADTVVNGDFSHGNTGFSSDYTASPTCSTSSPFTAGYYFVGANPNNCNAGWISMSDPTNKGLKMLIVNGAQDGTSRVWYETLATTPNTQFTFTFWMADIYNLSGDSPATLEFSVDGVVVSGCTGYSPTTPGQWQKEVCTYTSGSGTTETLALIDTNTAFEANDFALDDISDPPAVTVTLTMLHSFDGTDGASPVAPLVQAFNGSLYGTTLSGGSSPNGSDGTIFTITPSGAFTSLYSFCMKSGCPDGYHIEAGLAQATNGELYGSTPTGGVVCCGTVFKITPGGRFTTLDSLPEEDGSGSDPMAGLVQATNGSLYGTTVGAGVNGGGSVFKITPSGTLTTIYSFCPSSDGCDGTPNSRANGYSPGAGLIQATNGDLYGTTTEGGTTEGTSGNYGTVFKITPSGALTTLYSFCSKSNAQANCLDGYDPLGTLVEATNGDIYGTTQSGGANCPPYGCGTIFKITPGGTLTTLYSFCSQSGCADGKEGYDTGPALIQATDGNLYGTTPSGGAGGYGTVFQLTPSGDLTTIYSFCIVSGCPDGGQPFAGLVQDTNGTFYGTTEIGGTTPVDGTVFSLSIGLGPFVETLPTSGKLGAGVKILGTDLSTATTVTFNGTPAVFTIVSGSEITTSVPAGATTGDVQVKTQGGTLTSKVPFKVKK
jgi:uncharacterized repeat protein (TIGR03803 family)